MAEQVRGTNVTPLIFLFVIFGMIFGTWVFLMFLEACVLQWDESQIHCGQGVLYYSSVSCIIAVLAGFAAWATHGLNLSGFPLPTNISELPLALCTSFVIAVVFHGFSRMEYYSLSIDLTLFGWLGLGLLVCGIMLIIVNYCSRRNKNHEESS